MNTIPKSKIKELEKAGEDFKIPFCLPPFDGDLTEGSFDIHKFKEKKEFQDFLSIIDDIGVVYEYAYKRNDKAKKKHIYMTIKMVEK